MVVGEEKKKMVEVVKEEQGKFFETFKYYIAPDIPDKVKQTILNRYDSNLYMDNVVAFFDLTLFGTSKNGVVFTTDGVYARYLDKPQYVKYCDITYVTFDDKYPVLNNAKEDMKIYIQCKDTVAFARMIKRLREIDKEFGQTTLRETGKVKKIELPSDMKKKCHAIIHSAATAAGAVGTGLAQIPGSDSAVIVPIQLTMITTLGSQVFGLHVTESMAKSILASAGATIAGRTVSQYLVGWLPIIGNVINTTTAAGVTEAIGWIAVKNFYNRWLEDKNKGKLEGMKIGAMVVSAEYEAKLRQLSREFIDQKKNMKTAVDEYESLISDLKEYIIRLENEKAASEKINEFKTELEKLQQLKEV